MAHRIAALAGLALVWGASAFQAPGLPRFAGRMPASVHTATSSAAPGSVSARSSTWTLSIGGNFGDRQEGCRQLRRLLPLRAEAAAAAATNDAPEPPEVKAAEASQKGENEKGGPLKRVARFFGAGQKMPSIKELGLYAVLSYGFVSNASYSACLALAWFATSKKTGLSPLAPDQWQYFLASYAALFAVNNVLRVPRFALSVSIAPAFDRFIAFLMKKTGRGKAFATGLCVFLVNVLGTLTLLSSGVLLASLFSGVPFWPVPAS